MNKVAWCVDCIAGTCTRNHGGVVGVPPGKVVGPVPDHPMPNDAQKIAVALALKIWCQRNHWVGLTMDECDPGLRQSIREDAAIIAPHVIDSGKLAGWLVDSGIIHTLWVPGSVLPTGSLSNKKKARQEKIDLLTTAIDEFQGRGE